MCRDRHLTLDTVEVVLPNRGEGIGHATRVVAVGNAFVHVRETDATLMTRQVCPINYARANKPRSEPVESERGRSGNARVNHSVSELGLGRPTVARDTALAIA